MSDNTKNQTKEQDKATERPWKVKEDGHYFWILGNEKTEKGTKAVFVTGTVLGHPEAKANAALIVKAVNSHAALVEALEACYGDTDTNEAMPDHILKVVENALKLAKGEEKS